MDFVKSGMVAVDKFLKETFDIKNSYDLMMALLEQNGRGKVFDDILKQHSIYTRKTLAKCISVYRTHNPNIKLNADSIKCLKRFKNINKYIVTDGNKNVQSNKIKALRLEKYMKFCFITRRYGIKNEKPSIYCFEEICKIEQISPNELIYIGDNPHKDFIGLNQIGAKTIRIIQGAYKNIRLCGIYEANADIYSLDELTKTLIESL